MGIENEINQNDEKFFLKSYFNKNTLVISIFAVLAIIIYFVIADIDIKELFHILTKVDYILLGLGALFTILAIIFDGISWNILLRISSIKTKIFEIIRISIISFSFGLLIPSAGAIDTIMKVYLSKDQFYNENTKKISTSGEILYSVILLRLCGLISFIPISVYISYSLVNFFNISNEVGLLFILVIILLVVILTIFLLFTVTVPSQLENFLISAVSKLNFVPKIRKNQDQLIIQINKIIKDYSTQFQYLLKNKQLAIIAILFTFVSQIAHWISILLILYSINIPISLDEVAVVNFLAGTIDILPFGIPGMEGLKEISLSLIINTKTGNSTLAASGAILIQLAKFYFVVIIGLFLYLLNTKKKNSENV